MKRFLLKHKALLSTLSLVAVFLALPHHGAVQAGVLDSVGTSFLNAITLGIGKIFQTAFEAVILPLSAGVLSLCGAFLDATIRFSISTDYIFKNLVVINQSWTIIRDICNLFFIFALIWMSLSTILGISAYDAKRKLVQVIIAALIINFSLFFTKVMVDFSNIFATWLYGGIMSALHANGTESLAALISDRLGIATFWNGLSNTGSGLAGAAANLINPSQGLVTAVVRLLVVLAATYVFAYTAILFLTRAVTLIFLLTFSPIGFIGELLPQVQPYAKQWWKELMDALSFPIVYLLMLYISVQFINNITKSEWFNVTNLFGTQRTILGIDPGDIFKYVIVISMLFACLKVAKDASGQLGKAASGLAGGLGKFATSIGGGAAALTGQFTMGAASKRFADSKWLNEKIANGNVLAGVAKSGAKSVADFHFDPRTALDIGVKPGKGYTSRMKEWKKEQEEAQEAIAPEKSELAGGKEVLADAEHQVYLSNPQYGDTYRRQKALHDIEEQKIKDADEKIKLYTENKARVGAVDVPRLDSALEAAKRAKVDALAARDGKIKSDLEKIQSVIKEDSSTKDWKFYEKLHDKQGEKLAEVDVKLAPLSSKQVKDMTEDEKKNFEKLTKEKVALEAARRQQNAINSSKNTILGRAAKSVASNIPEPKSRIVGMLSGADLLRAAAGQITDNEESITKAMGDARAKPEKKKQQAKLEGIIKSLGDEAPPAPPATPTPTPTT